MSTVFLVQGLKRGLVGMVLFDGIQSDHLCWVEITKLIQCHISVLSNSSPRLIREFCGN